MKSASSIPLVGGAEDGCKQWLPFSLLVPSQTSFSSLDNDDDWMIFRRISASDACVST